MDRVDAAFQFSRRCRCGEPGLAGMPTGFMLIYPGRVPPADRPHRPLRRPDLASLAGSVEFEPFARAELAAATAAAVISHGRSGGSESLVDLADRVGLDTLAELWRQEQPSSLPGALWALYLLRRWCQSNGDEVTRLWRAGRPYAPADEVVAGVSEDADPAAIEALADAVLHGAYLGDFDVALERAAAFFRVIAAGRRETADLGVEGERERRLADRNDEVADGLTLAALSWRTNPL
ncbi:MAG: hypothetical protein QOI26_266 [Pseudonocardiales bacterium]|nr:hypothetical protein [Pseudonocardiales bacterium]